MTAPATPHLTSMFASLRAWSWTHVHDHVFIRSRSVCDLCGFDLSHELAV